VSVPRTPQTEEAGGPRRLPDLARRAGSLVGEAVLAGARQLAHLWRASLQFRVIVSTMLLGLVVVLALGSYLYQQIANGLVDARVTQARQDALQGSRSAQTQFDATDNTDATSMTQLATDVAAQLASPGADQSRDVILVHSGPSTSPAKVPTILSGDIGLPSIPDELRRAVAADSGRQKTQVITVRSEQTGEDVPAVIVGSQVTLPTAGRYELYFVFPMDREEATLAVVSRTFALGGIALVLLVGAVAYVVTRVVVDPVRRAALVAERLSSGRLNERMTARGEDDIARLAAAFNGMADNLQRQIRQLENLSRVQQRFSSDVSHELRTPLTTIRMAGEVLHDARADFAPPVARAAELLHAEIDRFEVLLTDLLEISRFDAGAAALDLEATDLRTVTARVVESAGTLAARRGSQLVLKDPGVACIAEVDPRRVERVLRNLLVNAVEHGEGRPVTVTLGVNETAVAVSVRDHGVGLRPGEAALVFNRFWRADPARARNTGGTGLGLAISLEDARLHEGWLQAWGEPGQGSCFRLTVPRRAGVPIDRSPLPLAPDGSQAVDGATGTRLVLPRGPRGPS
jgi:two-component system sensor histidine kinase MtrB